MLKHVSGCCGSKTQMLARLTVWIGGSDDLVKASHRGHVVYEDQVFGDDE